MNLPNENLTAVILFAGFFLLYGLEFFFPLVRRRSKHFWSNALCAIMLTSINLLFTSFTFFLADWVASNKIGLFNWFNMPIGFQILISIILLDFWAGYISHLIFHKHQWLWDLHTVHHSDDLVDVTTTFRQHPIESIIRISFHLTGMIALGIPIWILLIYLTLSTINAQIEHANIRIPAKVDKVLQYIFVTPNMHKIHHSKHQIETDSNYSNIFSFWDRFFNTFKTREHYHSIDYGLDYLEDQKHYSFFELIKLPFKRRIKNKLL